MCVLYILNYACGCSETVPCHCSAKAHNNCGGVDHKTEHVPTTCSSPCLEHPEANTHWDTRNHQPLAPGSESKTSDLDEGHLRSSTPRQVGVVPEPDEDISSASESTTSQNGVGSNIKCPDTIESSETLEVVKAHLLNDNRLQFLLPQVIRKYRSAEQRTFGISCLILHYSSDLRALAEKRIDRGAELASLRLSTVACLQRERRCLVEEICAHYWLQGLHIRDPGAKALSSTRRRYNKKPGGKCGANAKDKPVPADRIAKVAEFLFETEPFDQFKKLVQAKSEENISLPVSIRALDFGIKTAHNLALRLYETQPQPQVKRLHWTCVSSIEDNT